MPGHARKAFTVVELLAVVAILATMVTLAMPAMRQVRDSARSTACIANLRAIGKGIQQYAGAFDEYIPPGEYRDEFNTSPTRIRRESWETLLVGEGIVEAPTVNDPMRPDDGSSVFRCPAGSADVTGATGTARAKYSENNDVYVHSWYGCNGDPWFVEDYPMSRWPANKRSRGVLHQTTRAERPSGLVLVFDGSWMPRVFWENVWPMHGQRDKTNILFLDGHAETFSYRVLYDNWCLD